jgi:hypothetical protein
MIRLFEKTAGGLLVEVAPDRAEAAREGRMVSRVVGVEMDILFTPEEQAAIEAEREEVAQKADAERRAAEAAAAEHAERKAAAYGKLTALGLTIEDIEALKS